MKYVVYVPYRGAARQRMASACDELIVSTSFLVVN